MSWAALAQHRRLMKQYQCNVCAKIFGSFNDAAMCHPDVNVLEDVPVQPNSRPTTGAVDKGKDVVDLAFDEIVEDTVYGEGA